VRGRNEPLTDDRESVRDLADLSKVPAAPEEGARRMHVRSVTYEEAWIRQEANSVCRRVPSPARSRGKQS
jgi:hypothetical protein